MDFNFSHLCVESELEEKLGHNKVVIVLTVIVDWNWPSSPG